MTTYDTPTPDRDIAYPRASPQAIGFSERTAIHLCWVLEDVLTHEPADTALNPHWQYRRAMRQLEEMNALHGTCTRSVHLLVAHWGRWEPTTGGILRLIDLFEQALSTEDHPLTDDDLRYDPRENWY